MTDAESCQQMLLGATRPALSHADSSHKILASRRELVQNMELPPPRKREEEGGCGVLGVAASFPIEGRHLLAALRQMKNRGNSKGGGVALVGLDPAQWGADKRMIEEDYILQIAFLKDSVREELEAEFILPLFEVHETKDIKPKRSARELGLKAEPPEVRLYFTRPRPKALEEFTARHKLEGLSKDEAADELVYQNTYRLHKAYYASLGEKKALVLSHGKDMLNFKLVGYGDDVIPAYGLEETKAHVWIGHHRYPTKGKVWHPGGAHPFIGVNEALVHNGDFANYASICDSLAQHNIYPLFLTDTEVSVLLFDLLRRVYRYPLEYVIEALAPTTDRDFHLLPEDKKKIYKRLQRAHIHASPDGPWFFIIASHDRLRRAYELIGITDTSMLRPQVFALQEGRGKVGAIASEKQAIDCFFESLYEDGRVDCSLADMYWNARGGSYTDGGSFAFTVTGGEAKDLVCTDKFGRAVRTPPNQKHHEEDFRALLDALAAEAGAEEPGFLQALAELNALLDRHSPTGDKKRSSLVHLTTRALSKMLDALPAPGDGAHSFRLDFASRKKLGPPPSHARSSARLAVDAADFPSEGDESLARFIVEALTVGWKHLLIYRCRGQRFIGCGLASLNAQARLDVYGSPGDYLASGLDGGEVLVHASAQDQVGNIMKSGKLVIAGDVGQAFLYSAKGGEIFVLGNAAGRPLINAVGSPKVVINGTALDYLAESFMAGDPLKGGGFAVVNGMRHTLEGYLEELETPYPGGNLFSLASGGAVYVRDPRERIGEDQLNGGRIADFSPLDWDVVRPLLEENERLFGIKISELLSVDGTRRDPGQVYRKIEPAHAKALKA